MARERPFSAVPVAITAALTATLAAQVAWHHYEPPPMAHARALPAPPPSGLLRSLSLGDPIVLSKVVMLWLQAFDNPPGISIPFRDLDYDVVIQWLSRILELDPRSQYPLLAASRLYGEVPVEPKQRQMLAFVYQQFLLDPNRRWPWLAHAVYIAKHRLRDLPLARRYAQALTDRATGPNVPHWAKQMQIFVLEDMGEIDSARVLLGGLLDSGQIADSHERRFLEQRLRELEQRLN